MRSFDNVNILRTYVGPAPAAATDAKAETDAHARMHDIVHAQFQWFIKAGIMAPVSLFGALVAPF